MGGHKLREAKDAGIPFERASAVSPVAASGLRPVAVFVGIAVVFAAVATRSIYIQAFAQGRQPDALRERESPTAGFSIVDRVGRPLATSVECFDVTVSPRAMWRSHTPDRMCRAMAEILDGVHVSSGPSETMAWESRDVLARTMPRALFAGVLPGRIVPASPRFLHFNESEVGTVRAWLDHGTVPGELLADLSPAMQEAFAERSERSPIRGLTLVPLVPVDQGLGGELERRWTLALDPVECFGARTRKEQLGAITRKDGSEVSPPPGRWTRRLLSDLVALIGPDHVLGRFESERRSEVVRLQPIEKRLALRDALWSELLPTRFRVLARGIDPVRAHQLRDLMAAEAVSSYQLQLIPRLARRHPTRPGARPVAPDPRAAVEREGDAFALLGHWGVLDESRATARAVRDRENRPHVLDWEAAEDPFDAYRKALVVEERPWSGIELLCQTELENGPWAADSARAHAVDGRRYSTRLRHVARDRRPAWKEGVPNYFESAADGSRAPQVTVTLDAQLQEIMHRELGDLMESQSPALAMGIVLDIQTGDVLALDARSRYPYSGFAPVRHVFTPGSTFKAIIMGLALDAGVTVPSEEFPTYARSVFRVGRRPIGEADGAPTQDFITAAHGLAFSCNAVLVQIALKLEPRFLRGRLLEFGYAQRPGAGLGPELPGTLPPLVKGTWNRDYAHASVAFGHEVGVTLWQHAEALATLLRGGVSRPLRLLQSMERDGEYYERALPAGKRVLSEESCRLVRDMMAVGANLGTGRHVGTDAMNPEFEWIGTKTGTTEKVSTELCVHLELQALAEASRTNTAWTKERRSRLRQLAKPHKRSSCYTSSMCAAGRAVVDGEVREIMVLVVADDAMGKERFGSRVTGPTTIALLRQAFGFDRERASAKAVAASDAKAEASEAKPVTIPKFRADWLLNDLPWAGAPGDDDSTGESR